MLKDQLKDYKIIKEDEVESKDGDDD